MKTIRSYIVKALYPICSEEVQILLDQMRNHPDKFLSIIEDVPYRNDSPWAKALSHGKNFERWEYHALTAELRNLKIRHAKQLILEGLFESGQRAEARESTLNMFDSILKTATQGKSTTPSKIVMSKHQLDAAKLYMEKEAQKKTMTMSTKGRR